MTSYAYPVGSFIFSLLKEAEYEKQIATLDSSKTTGIILKSRETQWNSPVMLGNQNIHVPVGGGLSTEWKDIGSAMQVQSDEGKHQNYLFVKPTRFEEFFESTTFANQLGEVKPMLEHFDLYQHIPVTLPMQINRFQIPGKQVYLHLNTGLLDNNKQRLLSEIIWKKRVPGSVTLPVCATLCLAISWLIWSGYGEPPTDIWGKLIGKSRKNKYY